MSWVTCFWSPQAGVIVYMYNVGNYDPKKEPKANPQPVPGYSPVYSPYYTPKPVDPTPVIVAGSAITIWVILEYLGWGLLILI